MYTSFAEIWEGWTKQLRDAGSAGIASLGGIFGYLKRQHRHRFVIALVATSASLISHRRC
jgi:hypothetical protein